MSRHPGRGETVSALGPRLVAFRQLVDELVVARPAGDSGVRVFAGTPHKAQSSSGPGRRGIDTGHPLAASQFRDAQVPETNYSFFNVDGFRQPRTGIHSLSPAGCGSDDITTS